MPNSMKKAAVSRRAFLIGASGALAAGLSLPYIRRSAAFSTPMNIGGAPPDAEMAFIQPKPAEHELWGRITDAGSRVYDEPKSGNVRFAVYQNDVLPVLETARGEALNGNNDLWYRFAEGWVYTANVQPIRPYRMPTEIREIETQIQNVFGDLVPGFWGEIIVPQTLARNAVAGAPAVLSDDSNMWLFYGSTHRVVESIPDRDGFLWYKVADDKRQAPPYYVLARHMRMITPEELAPIHPGRNKRMEVNLTTQRINCYEDDLLVHTTLCASGGSGFRTPIGDHAVVYKQISRHMYSDPEEEAFSDPDYFDLPGVPFNTFFTTMGHAIHGTFWHGDYGRPRSHGCLNVTPEESRWLWRWVDPPTPYEALANGSSAAPGTPVIVTA